MTKFFIGLIFMGLFFISAQQLPDYCVAHNRVDGMNANKVAIEQSQPVHWLDIQPQTVAVAPAPAPVPTINEKITVTESLPKVEVKKIPLVAKKKVEKKRKTISLDFTQPQKKTKPQKVVLNFDAPVKKSAAKAKKAVAPNVITSKAAPKKIVTKTATKKSKVVRTVASVSPTKTKVIVKKNDVKVKVLKKQPTTVAKTKKNRKPVQCLDGQIVGNQALCAAGKAPLISKKGKASRSVASQKDLEAKKKK